MKTINVKTIALSGLLIASLCACKKTEYVDADSVDSIMMETSDSISMAATQVITDKKFVRTANIDMEVKDVYDATISIEKQLKSLGGFVTNSNLVAQTIEEDSYNLSDENAILVRKFQNQNRMQVRVPTSSLGVFLEFVNDKKIFLNSRIISAEDVTANINFSKLEKQRQDKTNENISKLKSSKDKIRLDDENMSSSNFQKYNDEIITDHLNYATVNISIKEPKTSVAKIPISNTKNIDNEYKYNFFYDVKNAFVEGFYMVQTILVFLITIWPIVIISAIGIYFWKIRKSKKGTNIE